MLFRRRGAGRCPGELPRDQELARPRTSDASLGREHRLSKRVGGDAVDAGRRRLARGGGAVHLRRPRRGKRLVGLVGCGRRRGVHDSPGRALADRAAVPVHGAAVRRGEWAVLLQEPALRRAAGEVLAAGCPRVRGWTGVVCVRPLESDHAFGPAGLDVDGPLDRPDGNLRLSLQRYRGFRRRDHPAGRTHRRVGESWDRRGWTTMGTPNGGLLRRDRQLARRGSKLSERWFGGPPGPERPDQLVQAEQE